MQNCHIFKKFVSMLEAIGNAAHRKVVNRNLWGLVTIYNPYTSYDKFRTSYGSGRGKRSYIWDAVVFDC